MNVSIPDPRNEQPASQAADLNKLKTLLKAKADTQRFVGLALLKSVLDNSENLKQDAATIQSLWESISSKFLDRLLRTGSNPSNPNSKEMLDLVVSVLHTFAVLLPGQSGSEPKFVGKIPGLVGAVLHSSEETTHLILRLLHTLVSSQEGAKALVEVDDITPLTEIASTHATVLDILGFAWLNSMTVVEDSNALAAQVDETIQRLISSFTGTDAVTLLEFLGNFLKNADPKIIPRNPKWLETVVKQIQNLIKSRPTPQARSAYTNAAATVLQTYQSHAPRLLFTREDTDDKDFSYLFINLLLIDIRSSTPVLLEQLNKPEYPLISRRLASAFDVIAMFLGYLIQSLDEPSGEFIIPPDNLLKLRKNIAETMSVTIEYLRDRWDASVAGAMGLHPDARAGAAETSMGSHHTITWDSLRDNADEDMLILSAIRALALWLREDDNDMLRKETTGLMDMFMDLYKQSSQEKLDFRSAVLVALEGLVTIRKGREAFLKHDGWAILTKDLIEILKGGSDISRGTEIIRILLQLVDEETGSVPEAWMDLITAVAAWHVPESQPVPALEFHMTVLHLCVAILDNASLGMRKRYAHSIGAIHGIAVVLEERIGADPGLRESAAEVLSGLESIRADL